METLTKRKVNSSIHFPRFLDMAPFLSSQTPIIYELSASLLHKGGDTNSGHYVARIKCDSLGGSWYNFDDEGAHLMKSMDFNLKDSANTDQTEISKMKEYVYFNAIVYTRQPMLMYWFISESPETRWSHYVFREICQPLCIKLMKIC